jgi:hypothetical protein
VTPKRIALPSELLAVQGPHGLRIVGEATPLLALLAEMDDGTLTEPGGSVELAGWTLLAISSEPSGNPLSQTISYSPDAWSTALGIMADVCFGAYLSPLDFGDVGYTERALPDIGLSILGVARRPPHRPQIPVLEKWPIVMETFAKKAEGILLRPRLSRPGPDPYSADLISLQTGDPITREYAIGPTYDVLLDRLLRDA